MNPLTIPLWKAFPGAVLSDDGRIEIGADGMHGYYLRKDGAIALVQAENLFEGGRDGVRLFLTSPIRIRTIEGEQVATREDVDLIRVLMSRALPMLGSFVRFG